MTKDDVELEPLYVSSSFLTTSLGCLSYSAVDKDETVNIFHFHSRKPFKSGLGRVHSGVPLQDGPYTFFFFLLVQNVDI